MLRLDTTARLAICAKLLALVFGIAVSSAVAADTDRLLVINGLGEYITLIDRAGDSVEHNVLTLGLAPNRIREATGAILVVNSVSDDIWVLDPETFAVQRIVTFPDGDNPWDVLAIDDTLDAVTMFVASNVALMNHTTGDTLGRVAVGKSPEGMLLVDGNLWVANTGFDFGTFLYDPGTVSVVNPHTGTPVTTIPVGTNPQTLATAPDGTVHVLCTGDYWSQFGIVYVIEPASMVVVDSIPLGGSPGDLVISHNGTAYVAAGGWADSGLVYVYDALARSVLNGSSNPWRTAVGVTAVSPRSEGGVFAVCFSGDSIVGHDKTGAVVEAYQVGDGPQALLHISNRVPGDLDASAAADAVDIGLMIDVVFFGGAVPGHPASSDLNGDCFQDSVDLGVLIDLVFFGSQNYVWGCVQ